jgi:N-acetyltransferase
MKIEPVILSGRLIQLVPLDLKYAAQLAEAGQNADIWKYMRYGVIDNEEKMHELIGYLLAHQEIGTDLPFVVIQSSTGNAIGMTRYLNIEVNNRGLEIGGTWYSPDFQHTGVNTEAKFLLLKHAFESLDAVRVQFKADLRNERSQRAIERLGAVREGVLRDHMILPDGTIRSSVFYSILTREWPEVKQHLIELMDRKYE